MTIRDCVILPISYGYRRKLVKAKILRLIQNHWLATALAAALVFTVGVEAAIYMGIGYGGGYMWRAHSNV